MKILITGLNGTLAPHFAAFARSQGHEVVGWERAQVNPEDSGQVTQFLDVSKADAIFHLGMGSEHWAEQMAAWANKHNRRFLFTSTAMVFHHDPDGPHNPDDSRSSQEDYGQYKIRCEDAILSVNNNALIVRIGWQLDLGSTMGNNMLAALTEQHNQQGMISASTRWIPATSHMQDTAAVAIQLLEKGACGVFHIDGNTETQLNFYELVTLIDQKLGLNWRIKATEDYQHDQRLMDDRLLVPTVTQRL